MPTENHKNVPDEYDDYEEDEIDGKIFVSSFDLHLLILSQVIMSVTNIRDGKKPD